MQTPLAGMRILDLTNVLAGPFACHLLAHMGAEVIKVELPGSGDLARQLGADPDLNARHMGVSFLAQNAGKRSVTLNLKTPRGIEVMKRLVAGADGLVENFRPGVMERLGVGFEALKTENPSLVYCAVSGFGQDGPLRDLPAYDQIVQGMAGVMSITGAPDTAPYRVGYPVADTIGGLTAAFAMAAQLAAPAPRQASFIDVSMVESVLATMGWAVSNYLIAGVAPRPMGNDNVTASPSGTFATGDGLLNIAANKQAQFEAVCDVVGRPDLKKDPRFAGRQARLENRAALTELLEAALAERSAADWVRALSSEGVPAGRVLSVGDALDHPQVRDRGMIATFDRVPGVAPPGTDRPVRVVRPGFKVNGMPPSVDAPPPELGADTDHVLAELGYSTEEIAEMHKDHVV